MSEKADPREADCGASGRCGDGECGGDKGNGGEGSGGEGGGDEGGGEGGKGDAPSVSSVSLLGSLANSNWCPLAKAPPLIASKMNGQKHQQDERSAVGERGGGE